MSYPTYGRFNVAAFTESVVVPKLRENFPDNDLKITQVLCLAEEAGEFVGAYRRWAGMARRLGSWDDVRAELADVAITAYVTANILGIDLDEAIREKAEIITTRGWRERPAEEATTARRDAESPAVARSRPTRGTEAHGEAGEAQEAQE